MKTNRLKSLIVLLMTISLALSAGVVQAEKPIVIGCPLATSFLYGWDAERGVTLAVEEINAAGGVNVAGEKRPFKIEVIDTRDLEPGVPVSEALLAVEKLILDKKADFIIGGPVRSEAALAAMPLLSKYKKVSILTTGVLTPKYNALVAEQYDKFKYCFRIHGEAKNLVGEIFANFTELKEKYGFNNLFIIAQDVSHARGAANIIKDIAEKKGWNVTGLEIYPTGATDFSIGLLKAKESKTEIINIWMDMPESAILLKAVVRHEDSGTALRFHACRRGAARVLEGNGRKGRIHSLQRGQRRQCTLKCHALDDEILRCLHQALGH